MSANWKPSSEEPSDELLIQRIAHGETTALAILYDRYAPMVLGICLKIVGNQGQAQKVLQETFWQIWQGAAGYDAQRGSLERWLFSLARNLAMNVNRTRPAKLTKK